MTRRNLICWLAPTLLLASTTHCLAGDDVGPLVRSLWLVQRYGNAESVQPQNDQKLKGKLSKALGKEGHPHRCGSTGTHGPHRPSPSSPVMTIDSIPPRSKKLMDADVPEARKRLNPRVVAHADC